MNLVNSFPEIEDFFKSELFNEEQLDNLIKYVKRKYTDESIQNSALTLIKLEIAKFEMIRNVPQNRYLIENLVSKKDTQVVKPLPVNSFPGKLPVDVTNLAVKLKLSKHHLMSLLNQKSIEVSDNEIIGLEGMLKLKPFIKSRLKAMGKHHLNSPKGGIATAKKYLEKEVHEGIGVYDKIGLYGLGKVIYIRSR